MGNREGPLDQAPLGERVEGEPAHRGEDGRMSGRWSSGSSWAAPWKMDPPAQAGRAVNGGPEEVRSDGDQVAVGLLGLGDDVGADRPDQVDEVVGRPSGTPSGSGRIAR